MSTGAPPRAAAASSWRGTAFVAYLLFVVYGSLVPLDFHPLPMDEAWRQFQRTPYLRLELESRADWIANGVLYVPLAALAVRWLQGVLRLSWAVSSVFALALCTALAFGVEFAQLFFPPRTVSQNDLIAECLGAVIGVAVVPRFSAWADALVHAWGADATRLARLVLAGYAIAYLLYAFFPFDLLLSRDELARKFASGSWGWLLASPDGLGLGRRGLQLLAEWLLAVPLGLAFGRRSLVQAALAGAAIGALIEVGQLFIATGISQGVSVLTRSAGVALGAWLAGGRLSVPAARAWLHRHLIGLLPLYLLLLMAAAWGRHRWGGWERAEQSWRELHWLPFYYHYYTSEAAALVSLGATVLMFVPLTVLAWTRRIGPAAAAAFAAVLAVMVEAGRLLTIDTHPDPTNVLIAAVSVWVGLRLLYAWDTWHRALAAMPRAAPAVESSPAPVPGPAPAVATAGPPSAAPPWSRGLAVLPVWVACLAVSSGWPVLPVVLTALLALAGALVAWRPALALLMLPLAMPVLDGAMWSGRFFVDEFDLLCALVLATAFARLPARPRGPGRGASLAGLPFAAFGLCLAASAALPLLQQGIALDPNSFSHLYSPFNGLRVLKGALEAWAFVALYRRLVSDDPSRSGLLRLGFVAALALVVGTVLWERAAFSGLFDFGADYRVTGPFSVMNKGGAYVECFLAAATAFALADTLARRGRASFWAGAVLLALSSFALLVTYSRNGYAALVAAVLVVLASRAPAGPTRRGWRGAVLLALVGAVAAPVLMGGYARERLSKSARDFDIRLRHWQAALDMRDPALVHSLFGMGLGRFPEHHAWYSTTEVRAAGFALVRDGGQTLLRLAPGAPVYIEQVVAPPPSSPLELKLRLRSAAAAAPRLAVTLCRKWMLTSTDCQTAQLQGVPSAGAWQTLQGRFAAMPAPARVAAAWLPVKLSLLTPGEGAALDVDDVELRVAGGPPLVHNGSFEQGMDRWLFATDVDPPWHIHSLPVALLFDLGWAGVLAGAGLALTALVGGLRALGRGSVTGSGAAGALVAFGVSGLLNTLFDEPRFLWLLLLLAWLCAFHGQLLGRSGRGIGDATRPAA
ncbi:MAG: VanZ family protein [Rubrivivax sp.]